MPDRATLIERAMDFMIGGSALEALRYMFNRKKNNAESDGMVADNWKKYAEHLENRFNLLMEQHEVLLKKYNEIERKYQELTLEVHAQSNSNRRSRRT